MMRANMMMIFHFEGNIMKKMRLFIKRNIFPYMPKILGKKISGFIFDIFKLKEL